jgi:TonB family protein
MREKTLGPGDPSVATARVKIADLQLLASQETMGPVSMAPVSPEPFPVQSPGALQPAISEDILYPAPRTPFESPTPTLPWPPFTDSDRKPEPTAGAGLEEPVSAPSTSVSQDGATPLARILVATTAPQTGTGRAQGDSQPPLAEDEDDEDDDELWPDGESRLRRWFRERRLALARADGNGRLKSVVAWSAAVIIVFIVAMLIFANRGAVGSGSVSGEATGASLAVGGAAAGEVEADGRTTGATLATGAGGVPVTGPTAARTATDHEVGAGSLPPADRATSPSPVGGALAAGNDQPSAGPRLPAVNSALLSSAAKTAESAAAARPGPGIPLVAVGESEFTKVHRTAEIEAIKRELQARRQHLDSLQKAGRELTAAESNAVLLGRQTPPGAGGIDAADSKPPMLVPGGAVPKYPDALRPSRIEGRVLAEFVVDTNGRANMDSFRVLESSDALFTSAVRAALPGMKFIPGEARGRKVAQRLQLPFHFTPQ